MTKDLKELKAIIENCPDDNVALEYFLGELKFQEYNRGYQDGMSDHEW